MSKWKHNIRVMFNMLPRGRIYLAYISLQPAAWFRHVYFIASSAWVFMQKKRNCLLVYNYYIKKYLHNNGGI